MRLDQWLYLHKFTDSRTKARGLVKSGAVRLYLNGEWKQILQPSYHVPAEHPVENCRVVASPEFTYVSRAAEKLKQALERSPLIAGAKCLDLGQSTGGFTQVLLQHGASLVVGVEVGHGQLHSSLRQDPRVNCIEGLHLKDVLQNADFIKAYPDGGFDLVVADLSFISLRPYLPLIASLGKKFILLIKPQFEVGPENLTKDFLPKENYSWLSLQRDFCEKFKDAGLILQNWFPSRIEGKEGNQEFLTILDRDPARDSTE